VVDFLKVGLVINNVAKRWTGRVRLLKQKPSFNYERFVYFEMMSIFFPGYQLKVSAFNF